MVSLSGLYNMQARGMHLMMLEFCYFANMLGAYMMYVDPQNAYLRKVSRGLTLRRLLMTRGT